MNELELAAHASRHVEVNGLKLHYLDYGTEGRRPMPRFQKTLSDEQRWHLVNYIRSLKPRD